MPLPILENIWENLSWILCLDYPIYKKGMNYVFVIVDMFSEIEHFIPHKKNSNASKIA
jgi:hypothetical protein